MRARNSSGAVASLVLFVLVALAFGACSLQRAPIRGTQSDAGPGIDAPVDPTVDSGTGEDVPMVPPDVPVQSDDAPTGCVPECGQGLLCTARTCACDVDECGAVGGECTDTITCMPCGTLEGACCVTGTRPACASGSVCGMGSRCELAAAECGMPGQGCCDGRTCSDVSTICLGGVCQTDPGDCGGPGEMCCPGNQCGDRTSCRRGGIGDPAMRCRACGGSFEACCPVGPACTSGGGCIVGTGCI